uniref:HDC02164 n=1 Tax=Drosophila melanogaster TaxID=7227 RepID=Q6IHM6_DROME|nr:TPA_inf: HDC02164 [Drosophila melanogaster]
MTMLTTMTVPLIGNHRSCRPLSLGKPEPVTKIKGDNIDVDNATMRLRSGLSCGPTPPPLYPYPSTFAAPQRVFRLFRLSSLAIHWAAFVSGLQLETKTQKLRPAQVLHLTGKNRAENPKEKHSPVSPTNHRVVQLQAMILVAISRPSSILKCNFDEWKLGEIALTPSD